MIFRYRVISYLPDGRRGTDPETFTVTKERALQAVLDHQAELPGCISAIKKIRYYQPDMPEKDWLRLIRNAQAYLFCELHLRRSLKGMPSCYGIVTPAKWLDLWQEAFNQAKALQPLPLP